MKVKNVFPILFILVLIIGSMMMSWLWYFTAAVIIFFLIIRIGKMARWKYFNWIKPIIVIALAIGFAVCIRVFAFEVYMIPSSSMENTIEIGDVVLVNKLKHGPSMPKSPFEIPWLNLFFYLNEAHAKNVDSVYWDYHRLAGYGAIERGDILVFEHPRWHDAFIKRCVALPGDTIEIRRGFLYVNGDLIKEPPMVKQPYIMQVNDRDAFAKYVREDEIYGQWVEKDIFRATLTARKAQEYASYQVVDFVEPQSLDYSSKKELFPGKSLFHHSKWSLDSYGPYVIPFSGMEIPINEVTDNHYWFLIRYRDGNPEGLEFRDGKFHFEGQEITHYKFKKDYYFFMGDNRHDSNDSRYWGPVQEDMIIGVANTVLFSYDHQFHWSRLLKTID